MISGESKCKHVHRRISDEICENVDYKTKKNELPAPNETKLADEKRSQS